MTCRSVCRPDARHAGHAGVHHRLRLGLSDVLHAHRRGLPLVVAKRVQPRLLGPVRLRLRRRLRRHQDANLRAASDFPVSRVDRADVLRRLFGRRNGIVFCFVHVCQVHIPFCENRLGAQKDFLVLFVFRCNVFHGVTTCVGLLQF